MNEVSRLLAKDWLDDAFIEAQFARYTMPITECGCLIWTGQLTTEEYGRIERTIAPSKRISLCRRTKYKCPAHRVAWVRENRRAIPKGMYICHHCDVRCCVNPDHLFLGTSQENAQDMARKGRNFRLNKLTEHDVIHIRESSAHDLELAKQYSVGRQTIYLARTRRTWREIAA